MNDSETAFTGNSSVDLRPVLDDIRDLRDSLESYQGLEHSLVELAKSTEFDHKQLSERMTELRDAIVTLTEVTKNAARHPAPINPTNAGAAGRLSRRAPPTTRHWTPYTTRMTVLACVGALLTAWSIRAYVMTGKPYVAILGLVVVNLAGCIAILLRRRSVR